MKCPKCSNPKMCKDGYIYGKYNVRRQYKCYKCGKHASELISGTPGKEFMKSREYAIRMSLAQLKRYKDATPEERRRWSDCHKGSHLNKPGKKLRLRRENFIGMLGDIEVYAMPRFSVVRSECALHNDWQRTQFERPKLTRAEAYRRFLGFKPELKKIEKRPSR